METSTDWTGAAANIQNSVHLGTWTNWSRGRVMGATLTLERKEGNLLIAFTAVFVGLVTGRVWRIACYVFHWCYSTPEPQDTLHHQRQALLRNSGSAASAVWAFANLTLAWQNIASRCLRRPLPALLTAVACVIAFAVAGGFSSQISSSLKNEVLLNGTSCGRILNAVSIEAVNAINAYKSIKITNAAN